jgi:hypothetical protein
MAANLDYAPAPMLRSPRVAAFVAVVLLGCAAQPPPHLVIAQAVTAPPPAPTAPPAPPPNPQYPMPVDPGPMPSAPATMEPMPPAIDQQPPAPNMDDVRTKHADPDGRGVLRTAGWVSLALGFEAAGVGILTGLIMLHDQHVRDQDCSNKLCTSSEGTDANTALGQLAPWNVGAWAVAALGIGAGAVLLLSTSPSTSKSDEGKTTTATTTSVGVSPGGITLRSTF